MTTLWYTIPKRRMLRRDDEEQEAIVIEQGFSNNKEREVLGIDGGLILSEAEDLAWRLKQGIHLLKHGKLPRQHL